MEERLYIVCMKVGLETLINDRKAIVKKLRHKRRKIEDRVGMCKEVRDFFLRNFLYECFKSDLERSFPDCSGDPEIVVKETIDAMNEWIEAIEAWQTKVNNFTTD